MTLKLPVTGTTAKEGVDAERAARLGLRTRIGVEPVV